MIHVPEEDAQEIIRIVDELAIKYDRCNPDIGFGICSSPHILRLRKRVRDLFGVEYENEDLFVYND